MIPHHLHLRNARVFESLDLDLPEGAVAISAPNGSGKSTLVSAIDVALFGAESRSLADWLSEDRPEETLTICLTFEAGGQMYRVRRTFSAKRGGKVDLEHRQGPAWEELTGWVPLTRESTAATQALIEEVTGLTRDTFRASSFISAGTLFCDLAPREQKRILAELLNLQAWDGWLERARSGKRQAELDLAAVRGMLERAEPELAESDGIALLASQARETAAAAQASLDSCLARLLTARSALAEAQARAASRAGAEKGLQDAERALSEVRAGLTSREDALRALAARLELKPRLAQVAAGLPILEAEQEEARAALAGWEERQRLLGEHERAFARREALDLQVVGLLARASEVEATPGEPCDRCGQPLHDEAQAQAAQSLRGDADTLWVEVNRIDEHELVSLNEKISALPAEQPDVSAITALNARVVEARSAREQVAALAEAETRRDALADELAQMRAGLPSRAEAVSAARAELQALGPHDPDEIPALLYTLTTGENDERRHRADLSTAEQDTARHEERLARLDRLADAVAGEKERERGLLAELELLAGLERACGPNGVPALILENVAIPQIEAEANRILALFGSKALGVELRTQREKKTGGLADTLSVEVLTEFGSRDVATFSTGERLRVNAALTLALAQLVAARSSTSGLLVIDDLGPLDSKGMAVLADICRGLATRIGRVYVISQAPELRDAFEQSLEVVSDGAYSRVVGAGADTALVEAVG